MSKMSKMSKLLRVKQVANRLGVSKSTVWRWAASGGDFPSPFKLSDRVTVWHESQIMDYILNLGGGRHV